MANDEHFIIIQQGQDTWNKWRKQNPKVVPDLRGADLRGIPLVEYNLNGAKLSEASLHEASLSDTRLVGADLRGADLSNAYLVHTDLRRANLKSGNLFMANLYNANLKEACLVGANLLGASLYKAKLDKADLTGANLELASLRESTARGACFNKAIMYGANLKDSDLSNAQLIEAGLLGATLVETNLEGANLTGCQVYGASVWNVALKGAIQKRLVISNINEPTVIVDNLEVAQFIYLLLRNEKIRDVIDTITSKAVLILGRFTPDRKIILDMLRDELRKRDYLPILFDFDKPAKRDLTETVQILAGMARFVIADLTDAKSIPQELSVVIPHFPSIPIQPILLASEKSYALFEHWQRFNSVLPTMFYEDEEYLRENLEREVIKPVTDWRVQADKVASLERQVLELQREAAELRKHIPGQVID